MACPLALAVVAAWLLPLTRLAWPARSPWPSSLLGYGPSHAPPPSLSQSTPWTTMRSRRSCAARSPTSCVSARVMRGAVWPLPLVARPTLPVPARPSRRRPPLVHWQCGRRPPAHRPAVIDIDLIAAQGDNGHHHMYRLAASSFIPRPRDAFPYSEALARLHDASPLPPPSPVASKEGSPLSTRSLRRRPRAEIVYPPGFKVHSEFDHAVIHESSEL